MCSDLVLEEQKIYLYALAKMIVMDTVVLNPNLKTLQHQRVAMFASPVRCGVTQHVNHVPAWCCRPLEPIVLLPPLEFVISMRNI